MSRVAVLALVLAACGSDDARSFIDAAPSADAAADATDAAAADASAIDAAAIDASVDAPSIDAPSIDAPSIDAAASDASIDATTDASADAASIDATPPTSDHHIHINVSNTCVMSVSPLEITIPANQTAYFDWHNHSVDYAVDVWMSYGGGYLDLPPGQTWNEPIGHCGTPSVHTEYADISTACSSFRFLIHCN